jgi:hypothetical protein
MTPRKLIAFVARSSEIADVNADTFGVAGCGRKVSYVLLCEYRTCRAVQNTQSQ